MIRTLLFLLLFPLMARATDLPAPITDTVSDYAAILDAPTEQHLMQTLKAARQETGVHIALVTMNHIASFGGAGQDIETYAENLFNRWGIGDAQRDDGILILVAVQDRAVRIALGSAFDPAFNDVAQGVINTDMLPSFKTDRYALGIAKGVEGTIQRLARPFVAHQIPGKPGTLFDILFGLLAGLAVIGYYFRSFLSQILLHFRRCPACGHRGLVASDVVIMPPSPIGYGQGKRTVTCPSCSWQTEEVYMISNGSRSGTGGGSSGFGGGSSSGGGATGRW